MHQTGRDLVVVEWVDDEHASDMMTRHAWMHHAWSHGCDALAMPAIADREQADTASAPSIHLG